MTPLQLFRILWARKLFVLSACVLALAAAVIVNTLSPKTYTATAEVIIDLKSPDPVLGREASSVGAAGFIGTQVDIIASERVARRVVATLALDQLPNYLADWKKATGGRGDLRNWLAEFLLKKLDVRPSKEGNVVRIAFKAPTPALAAKIANGFANAYLETVVQLKLDPARQNAEFFTARVQGARAEVDRAQAKLSAFQREHNITVSDEKLDVENARLTELSTQLVTIQGLATEARSREAQAARRNPEAMQEVLESRLVQTLRGDLAKAEAKLKEQETTFGTAHPQYQATQAEVASLKSKVDAEIARYVGSVSTSGSVLVQREAQTRAALEAQRTKVLRLKTERDQMSVLQKEVESAQKSYELIAQRQIQTTMESENRQVNVALLTAAVEPILPSSPKLLLNLLIGGMFGLLLGVAIALVREMTDRRARTPEDIVDTLALPVLVSVPTARPGRPRHLLPDRLRLLMRA
jgi:chain length determinant protein EpsF